VLAYSIDQTANLLGIEAEPVQTPYAEVEAMVAAVAPAILRLPSEDQSSPHFVLLLKSNSRRATLIAPDLSIHRIPSVFIRNALCAPVEAVSGQGIERLLEDIGIVEGQRAQVRNAIFREQLSAVQIQAGWMLRMSPGTSTVRQGRHARLWRPVVVILIADLIAQLLLLATWVVIGRGVFSGLFDGALLWAWALLLFTGIPFQMLTTYAEGQLATRLGSIIKSRLLYGTLKLEPEEIRHQGLGQFLGRVMDADAVELLAIGGGLEGILGIVQLFLAVGVLAAGAAGATHSIALILVILLTIFLAWRYLRENLRRVNTYRGMTNDLVERMVGHRTRLAQEQPARRHLDEDRELENYFHLSQSVDRSWVILSTIPRVWMVVGLAGIALEIVSASHPPALLAISIGGILLALQSLTTIVAGVHSVAEVLQAWTQVGPLFAAASRPNGKPSAILADQDTSKTSETKQPVIAAKEISFRYRERGRVVLQGCTLNIFSGDQVLLEGPSGGGKSTLAAVMAGLRVPESGLLHLWGYDRQTIGGEAWRRRVAVAPQFHENHVFAETLAFNLLMGRQWPPTNDDLERAQEICRDLGLGHLLEQMPSGMQQMIGESGWQLSHGERSRLYIARALLQGADLMIFDESFAALDPENLERALRCVLQRAPTIVVIAHP